MVPCRITPSHPRIASRGRVDDSTSIALMVLYLGLLFVFGQYASPVRVATKFVPTVVAVPNRTSLILTTLKKKLRASKAKLERKMKKVKKLKEELKNLRVELKKVAKYTFVTPPEMDENTPGNILLRNQITLVTKGMKWCYWGNDVKEVCLAIYLNGAGAYRYLCSILCLPSVSTLSRFVQTTYMPAGTSIDEVRKLLKQKFVLNITKKTKDPFHKLLSMSKLYAGRLPEVEFHAAFKQLCENNFFTESKTPQSKILLHDLLTSHQNKKCREVDHSYSSAVMSCEVEEPTYKPDEKFLHHDNSLVFVCGWLARKVLKVHNCSLCAGVITVSNVVLQETDAEKHLNHFKKYDKTEDFTQLCVPTDLFYDVVNGFEKLFCCNIAHLIYKDNVLKDINNTLLSSSKHVLPTTVCEQLPVIICDIFCKMRLFFYMKFKYAESVQRSTNTPENVDVSCIVINTEENQVTSKDKVEKSADTEKRMEICKDSENVNSEENIVTSNVKLKKSVGTQKHTKVCKDSKSSNQKVKVVESQK